MTDRWICLIAKLDSTDYEDTGVPADGNVVDPSTTSRLGFEMPPSTEERPYTGVQFLWRASTQSPIDLRRAESHEELVIDK